MKKSFLLAFFLLFFFFGFAQNDLVIQSGDKGLFLTHSVAAKENFYSIGRLYNVPPKDIAAYNNLDMNLGLNVGQSLFIPLNASNFSQSLNQGRPIFYVVGQKEGLYRVSLKNNNVLMADLRKWNQLSSDQLSTGQKLIVGFLISPEADQIVAVVPEVKKVENKTEVRTEPVKENPVQEVVKKDPPKVEKKAEAPSQNVTVTDAQGGYFSSHFQAQTRTQPARTDQTVSAGIFKTASGWQDAKYYALIDGVETGSIVKVINPSNGKTIYAKVLGEMSGIRQNLGYDLRISNAAASALDVTDTDKFIVRVNY